MCARYTLRTPADLLAERFGLTQIPILQPRFNVAPSQLVPVIGANASGRGRSLAMFKWGLVPSWSQDDKEMRPVNARAETIASTPFFSESLRRRRSIVPADGFYEWRTVDGKKLPVHFHLKSDELFGFAGVWDVWNGPSGKLFSVAIVTTKPNELSAMVHDRMPVILARDDESNWLDPAIEDPEQLLPMLKPYPADSMAADAVNPALNKPGFEGPECLQPMIDSSP
jgi:putative SOS response-associated peptidase YedK